MDRFRTAPLIFLLLATCCTISAAQQNAPSDGAHTLVRAAMQAMGGEDRLRAVHSLQLKGIGHRYMLEQSERPEGPWLIDYFQSVQIRDVMHSRLHEERQSRGCGSTECWKSAEWSPATTIAADHVAALLVGPRAIPADPSVAQAAEESLALSPERILFLALEAPDLHQDSDITFHGFLHHILSFTWEGNPVRLFLSTYGGFPSAVEITRTKPYDIFWNPWGDVTTRIIYGFWVLEPGGLHYPHQWTYESNGQPDWTFTINELTLNPALREDDFAIPDSVKKAFAARTRSIDALPLGLPNSSAQEIKPGIVFVPGAWNVEEIRQADGIVIIEGPISNGYSQHVIDDAKKRFPGLRIKAVITTSDAWPHIGGLREYAAQGIPIYALDLNKPILERLLSAPHRLSPDALQKNHAAAKMIYISHRTKLGDGPNMLEIIPIRTATGERQMFVYLPAQKILYTSDLYQRDAAGTFYLPEALSEAINVVHRENLDVQTNVGMHISPISWHDVETAVDQVIAGAPTQAEPKP